MNTKKIILDTDIGYDPDDLFALILLHKIALNDIELIVTANEKDGKRSRFVKKILQTIGNTHTTIAEGQSIGMDKFIVDHLIYDTDDTGIEKDYLSTMKKVVEKNDNILYIGIGGFTNLAKYIDKYPEDKNKFTIYLMGGAINYVKKEGWKEFNVKIDPISAKKVIESGWNMHCIMAQTTHNPIYEITEQHIFYKKLLDSSDTSYKILADHCKTWFETRIHGTTMHDPLTIVTALGMDFVSFHSSSVSVTDCTINIIEKGNTIKWTDPVSKAAEFMDFLDKTFFK